MAGDVRMVIPRSTFLSAISPGDIVIVDGKEYIVDEYLVAHTEDGDAISLNSYNGEVCVKFFAGESVYDFMGCYKLDNFYVEVL